MALPPHRLSAALMIVGGVFAVLAATLLWVRFGPSVFADALNAVWTCL